MTDSSQGKAVLALAKLEACAARVASGAMQMRVALAVASTAPRYADQLRLAADASRLQYLALEADAALAAIEEVPCSDDSQS